MTSIDRLGFSLKLKTKDEVRRTEFQPILTSTVAQSEVWTARHAPAAVVDDETRPKHVAKDVVGKIQSLRNLIHPARALRERYDPQTFTREQLEEYKDMYRSVMHSLLYYL